MSRTATVRARIEPGLKADVEIVLARLGLSTTEAINLFYHQILLRRGLPFPVEVPKIGARLGPAQACHDVDRKGAAPPP